MPPTKFRLNPNYHCREDGVWRFSRWPSWKILEQNDFGNSESLHPSDASHQILAQSTLTFGRRCCLKCFKMDILMERIQQFWISMSPQCLPPSFSLIQLTVWEQMAFQDFQDGHHGGHLGYWYLGYWYQTSSAILNLHVTLMPPTQFGLSLTYRSGAEVVWRFSRWPP